MLVKFVVTIVASVFVVSSTIPPLAPFSAVLAPIGTFLLGAYHVDMKPAVKA